MKGDALYVNFYAQSEGAATVAGTKVTLKQTTEYPWKGVIALQVSPEKPTTFTVRVRIPEWAQGKPVPSDLYSYDEPAAAHWAVNIGGKPVRGLIEKGYVAITRKWKRGDVVTVDFSLPVQQVRGNEKIAATRGLVALERGPVVYCFEQTAGQPPAANVSLSKAQAVVAEFKPSLLDGVAVLKIGETTEAIPYFAWNNRGLLPMTVWVKQ